MVFTLFLTQQFKMTKENRERTYKHFRSIEKNYEARDGLNSGPTATQTVRARAKANADAILAKHPELNIKEVENVAEDAPVEQKKEETKPKSKGKK